MQAIETPRRDEARQRIRAPFNQDPPHVAIHPEFAGAQVNFFYVFAQGGQRSGNSEQYVPEKLHLTEAHRLATGKGIKIAVIDSQVDGAHPDLAGAITASFRAYAEEEQPHLHGTGMHSVQLQLGLIYFGLFGSVALILYFIVSDASPTAPQAKFAIGFVAAAGTLIMRTFSASASITSSKGSDPASITSRAYAGLGDPPKRASRRQIGTFLIERRTRPLP